MDKIYPLSTPIVVQPLDVKKDRPFSASIDKADLLDYELSYVSVAFNVSW